MEGKDWTRSDFSDNHRISMRFYILKMAMKVKLTETINDEW